MTCVAVTLIKDDWIVTQDGTVISRLTSKSQAMELGLLVAVATKAAGGKAELLVVEGGGRALTCDLDRPFC